MEFNLQQFNAFDALLAWLQVVGVVFAIGALIAFIFSFIHYGTKGTSKFIGALGTSLLEIMTPVPRRVIAIATLTFREAIRNKVLLVFVLFILLFMFAGWFMNSDNERADLVVNTNVSFALKVITGLVVLVLLLLSCWGIPLDIKARSIHTVVTKPVTSMEIVLGRFFGYLSIGTIILMIMGSIGYLWIIRQTPEAARKQYLVCRSPRFGELSFINREGKVAKQGINVGDMSTRQSYIQGGTDARAVWVFKNISQDDMVSSSESKGEKHLQLESKFGVFRTHKGDINTGVTFKYFLVNDQGTKSKDDDLTVPLKNMNSKEFSIHVTNIPQVINYQDDDNEPQTANLFKDIIHEGTLKVEVACLDGGQNIGMGRPDLFIRAPDKRFIVGYSKAIFSIWLLMGLVISLSVSASTFVKGPVATISVLFFIGVGVLAYGTMSQRVEDWKAGKLVGGGAIESASRIVKHQNPSTKLNKGTATTVIQTADLPLFYLLAGMSKIIPDVSKFDTIKWVAKGFDVPWRTSLYHAIAISIGFIVPSLLLGFFSLKFRELESK